MDSFLNKVKHTAVNQLRKLSHLKSSESYMVTNNFRVTEVTLFAQIQLLLEAKFGNYSERNC